VSDVEFGELPHRKEVRGAPGRLAAAYTALVDRPGEWAKIGTYKNQNSASSTARIFEMRYSGTEAVTRGSDMWARYVGEVD
jgi:hypothetical protein